MHCIIQRIPLLALAGFFPLALGCADESPPVVAPVSPVTKVADTDTPQTATHSKAEFDWPCWRGPNADGISQEKGWKVQWPDAGPTKLWQQKIGTGFSSMSVAKGKLYTMGHRDGQDTVWCFDAVTGKEIWKHSYACQLVDNLHEGGPAATPTLDGDRVYTISKEGHFFCFNAHNGQVKWSKELQRELEVAMPEWGFSGSVVMLNDALLVEAGRLAAFNKQTGDLIWKTKPYRPGYGSPLVFQHVNTTMVASLNNDGLQVVNAANGEQITTFPWETNFATTSTTPIWSAPYFFLSSGYDTGCALLNWKEGQLQPVYQNKNMRNHMNNCVLWEGHLYGFDGNSHNSRNVNLACIDFRSGEVKWKHRGLGCGSLMVAGGYLLILGDDGTLVTAPINAEKFEPISQASILNGRCWTVPVLSNGLVYARNAAGDLVCVDVRN